MRESRASTLGILLALAAFIVALLNWLAPFSPIGPSPIARQDLEPNSVNVLPTESASIAISIPTAESNTTSTLQLGDTRTVIRGGLEVEQVFVPAGSFMMGSEEGDDDEHPVHEVTLNAFWIDRTEVTNAQYEKCMAAGACQTPSSSSSITRENYYGNPEYANFPVIYVTWEDARDFAEWTGGRLPTEAEWEYAARGPDSLQYPWGNTFDGHRLNFCDSNCPTDHDFIADKTVDDGYVDTAPIGSYPDGASWVGALDMAGNVGEWVTDWYDAGYYARSPATNSPGPDSGDLKVVRGGDFWGFYYTTRSASRDSKYPRVRGSFLIGLRVVDPLSDPDS